MKRERIIFCLIISLSLPVCLPEWPCVSAQGEAAELRLAGLKSSVTVRRDERAIPYIEASTEEDLYFAQGYVTASDRLWQMDLLRRTGRGELSEIFGRGVLEEDKQYRTYGFTKLSEGLLGRCSPAMRAALEAYARGVNAFIDSRDDKTLPVEFRLLKYKPRAWTPADSIIVGKTFSVTLSTTWQSDIMRAALADLPADKRDALLPETSPLDVLLVGSDGARKKAAAAPSRPRARRRAAVRENPVGALLPMMRTSRRSLERVGLYAEGRAVSNNWVVSGKHTATGKPLLANDPHLAPSAPSIWYMSHLSTPGMRVAGVTIPGAPGVIIGHNERIAWGLTNLQADVQDLYIEKFDQENPRRYRTPAGWREAEVRREQIKVRRGIADASTDTVEFDVTVTEHGPIILQQGGNHYALRWTALDPNSLAFETFYKINHARNWDTFRAALRTYVEPAQNFVYADVDGHIGYYGAGKIPVRKTGDGSLPYDGSTGAGEWTGFVPFEKLPQLYDPPSGIIVTANNRITGRDYPYLITREWAQPYRARRIFDLLQSGRKLTADDFRAIQGDTYSFAGAIFAREVVEVFLDSARAGNANGWAETLRLFETWDGHVRPDSRASALVSQMRGAFRRRILVSAIGAERAELYSWANADTFLDRVITERPREWLPEEFKDYAELLRACYADARAELVKRLGADESQWRWGHPSYAQSRFPHPLASAPFVGQQFKIAPLPQNGSSSSLTTVNVGAGVSMRFIADTSRWDRTQQGIPLGQSGDPSNPHWADQLADWRDVTPGVFPFTGNAVAEAAKRKLVLAPSP
ncbi:MAG TPA: penicillin acylase family protein [Blastocatellia bacterium]|nr:penicillin acylase family protein [Blastocatellia bacterium]